MNVNRNDNRIKPVSSRYSHLVPYCAHFCANFGGVLRDGRYVNRDATMLNLIVAVMTPVETSEAPKADHEVVFLFNFFDELRGGCR